MQELLEYCEIKPMVNQIEYHIWNQRKEQINFCLFNSNLKINPDIVVEGWGIFYFTKGPLAGGALLKDEKILQISKKYNKSVSQICIRWSLQNNVVTIPKASSFERIKENSDVFDFEISNDDMKILNSFDKKFLYLGFDSDNIL
jgi:methylglyoxal/glyoxal reductase